MRSLQIGIIGSCSDLNYSKDAERFVGELGKKIAKRSYVLVFGAEKDIDSLPTVAAVSAKKSGGTTIGITYEKGMEIYKPEAASVVVATRLVRGGGREMTLMLSCDFVIAIAGGSGTLNEITIAYQANIPVVVIDRFGGWSQKLAGEFLHARKRYAFEVVSSPDEAMTAINAYKDSQLVSKVS